MKKLLIISLFFLGLSNFQSCKPDSLADQEYEEIQATDKNNVGTIGNSGGHDQDEDHD